MVLYSICKLTKVLSVLLKIVCLFTSGRLAMLFSFNFAHNEFFLQQKTYYLHKL